MSPSPIGLGVIGFGSMGQTLCVLKDVPDLRFDLRAVCSLNPDRLRQRAQQAGVPFWTTDYRELLARKDVDVVAVFSPDHLHAEHSLAAIKAGKHVVCGKPAGVTLDEVREIVSQVRQKGVKFLAAYTMRQDQMVTAAKKLFDDGDLGQLIALEGHYIHDMRDTYANTPWRLQAPQDMMFGGCMHILDILRFFGGDVEWVQAIANQGHMTPGYPIADNFYINLKFQSGAIGRVSGLYGVVHPPVSMHEFHLYGTKGSLVSELGNMQMRVVLDKIAGHPPMVTNFSQEPESRKYGYGLNMVRYFRQLQDCIDTDREPSPGVIENAKSVAVGAAAWESIHTGQAVQVCQVF